jgi:DNA repair protein RecO (recombination protein O)
LSQERSEALVLRGVDFSETSRIITFLTPDRGLVPCMVKGIKRAKSPSAAALDTLNRVEAVIYWKASREVQLLGEASLLDDFNGIKADLEKVTLAAFPVEVASKVAHDNEPSAELYQTLVHGLTNLARWRGLAKVHCCWQVLHLLGAAGYQPELEVCIHCGRAVSETPRFSYSGGVACAGCAGDRLLTREEYAALRQMAADPGTCPNLAATGNLLSALRYFASRQLETDFRSMRVIEQVVE